MAKKGVLVFSTTVVLGLLGFLLFQPNCGLITSQTFSPDFLFQESLRVAESIEDAYFRSQAFYRIAYELARAGRKEQAKDILKRALNAAMSIERAWLRSQTFGEIAGLMLKLGMKKQAFDIFKWTMKSAESNLAETERILIQSEIVLQMVKVGLVNGAVKMALIAHDFAKDRLIKEMVELKEFEGALKVAEKIEEPYWRLYAFTIIAAGLSKLGQKDRAIRIWERVLRFSQRLENDWDRDCILREIALGMAKVGLFDRATKVARGIKNAEYRAWTYSDIAVEMSKVGKKKQAHHLSTLALKSAMGIKEANYRLLALSYLALNFADAGFYDMSLSTARAAQNEPFVRVRIVKNLATERKFEEAMKIAQTINDASFRLSALKEIVVVMAKFGMKRQTSQVIDEVLKIPKENIKDPIDATKVLIEIGEETANAGMKVKARDIFTFAVKVAQDMKPEPWSSIAERSNPEILVGSLLLSMVGAGFIDEALQAAEEFAKSKSVPLGQAYPQVVSAISLKLAAVGEIGKALELTHSIENPYFKATSLAGMAKILLRKKPKHDGTQ